MSIVNILWISCDNNIIYDTARDAISGAYLNSGTCTYALYDVTGITPIPGASGSLSYVAASNGRYLGVLDATVAATLVDGTTYLMKYVFNQGNYDDTRWVPILAQKRAGL